MINDTPDEEIRERFFLPDLIEKPPTLDQNNKCGRWLYWVLQLVMIFSICFLVSTCVSNNESFNISAWPWAVGILCVSYTVYVLFFMNCLDTVSFMSHVQNIEEFSEYYEKIRQAKIDVKFIASNYHYGSKSKKVTTSINEKTIGFDFDRDLTEKLILKSGPEFGNPQFIKFAFYLSMKIEDQKTFNYYEAERSQFFNENSGKDTYMDFTLKKLLEFPEFSKHILVKIKPNLLINMFSYILFTYWIPLGTFYLAYLESSFNIQLINIVKRVSLKNADDPDDGGNNNQQYNYEAPNNLNSQAGKSGQNEQFVQKNSENFNENFTSNNSQPNYQKNDLRGDSELIPYEVKNEDWDIRKVNYS